MLKKNNRVSSHDGRYLALIILNKYEKSSQRLDKIIDNNLIKLNNLSRIDRAFLNHLVYGVIRWRGNLDCLIESLSERNIQFISPTILNILRMGLFQIFFMSRVPKFAAVDSSVEMVKVSLHSKKLAGYVNAILRNAIRKPQLIEVNKNKKYFIQSLSHIKSFPRWILSRWIKRFGYKETSSICDAINTIPDIFIRVNTLKTTKNELKFIIDQDVRKIEEFHSLDDTLIISGLNQPINLMKAFSKGLFSVQNGAAQMASYLLSPKPGELILDACAGLGGKSTHIAQLMNDQGRIIAADNIKSKLTKLVNDAKRLGIKIIKTEHIDLTKEINFKNCPLFDHILLDAPCSGLGILQKNPDIKWSSNIKKIISCSAKQLSLIKNISSLVKPRGTLLYVVCSTEPEENEYVINSFLEKNKNFRIKKPRQSKINNLDSYIGKDNFFRSYPHIHKIDSFFMALLERKY